VLPFDRVEEPHDVLLLRRIARERPGARFLANRREFRGVACGEHDLEPFAAEDACECGAEPHAGAHDEAGGHEPRDLLPARFFVEAFFVALRDARFCLATFAACFESAVRVFFGRCAMVLLRFAAATAFFTLRLAAVFRFVAMATSFFAPQ
jgi:hypothetical protein